MKSDRRQFKRISVLDGFVEPITVDFNLPKAAKSPARASKPSSVSVAASRHVPHREPALMTDLSAGGMSLLLFSEPLKAKKFQMTLVLPGLDHVAVEGKIVRVNKKGETYAVGIAFTKVARKMKDLICRMADDNCDCDTRITLRLPDPCVPNCAFHNLCAKPHKGPYWKK